MGGLGSGSAAIVREAGAQDAAAPVSPGAVATPVLSVRRVPSLVAAPVATARLRRELAAWSVGVPEGACVLVHDDEGDPVLDVRGDSPVRPASTQKLLTAAAALLELGGDHRFRTTAVGVAPVDGTVAGDLTLVGGGDPVLATADYMARYERQPQTFTDLAVLADRIVAAGVRRVDGSVVGDEARYDQLRTVPGWPARYVTQRNVGPLSALALNDGFATYPTVDDARPLVPAEDPAAHAAAVLTVLLEARGVDVVGAARSGGAPPGAVELAALESPPLTDIVEQLLRESDNATAELLTKELGRSAAAPTTAGGVAEIRASLDEEGLDLDGATVVDGSGLSLDDRVTCSLLVQLLEHPQVGADLRARLPVAGRSGTLADRFVGTPLAGSLRAKTGFLNTVAALAGVAEDSDAPLTFAYIVYDDDGVDEGAVIASQLALGEILLAWPRTPDVAVLGPRPVDAEASQ